MQCTNSKSHINKFENNAAQFLFSLSMTNLQHIWTWAVALKKMSFVRRKKQWCATVSLFTGDFSWNISVNYLSPILFTLKQRKGIYAVCLCMTTTFWWRLYFVVCNDLHQCASRHSRRRILCHIPLVDLVNKCPHNNVYILAHMRERTDASFSCNLIEPLSGTAVIIKQHNAIKKTVLFDIL